MNLVNSSFESHVQARRLLAGPSDTQILLILPSFSPIKLALHGAITCVDIWILVSPNLNFNIFCEFQFPYFKLCQSRNEVHFQQIPGNPEITNRFLPSFLPNECCRLSSPNLVRFSETALQNRHKSSRCGKCIIAVVLWVTLCDLHSSDHRRHRFIVLG